MKTISALFPGLWLVLACPWPAPAQRIYNHSQDEKAAIAVALGRELAVSGAFDKALANLGELQRLRNEDVFRSARLLMSAEMGSWGTWDELDASLTRFADALARAEGDPVTPAQLQAARESAARAEAELAQLSQMLARDPLPEQLNLAGDWMLRISKVKPLADYLAGLETDAAAGKAHVKAAAQAQASLEKLAGLYQNFRLDLPAKPSSLFLEARLAELDLEVQHLENLAAIQQRLDAELKDIRAILNDCTKLIKPIKTRFPDRTIQASLDLQIASARANGGADTEALGEMLFLLYNASALAARSHTPLRLAQQRQTLEDRAHALRKAGAASGAYEAVILNGLQRLALYYKGGIKPANLADLIQAFATAGLIPAIAGR